MAGRFHYVSTSYQSGLFAALSWSAMADEVLLTVTEKIKSSLERHSDTTLLDKIKTTESGDVIEYKYLSQIFGEMQRQGRCPDYVKNFVQLFIILLVPYTNSLHTLKICSFETCKTTDLDRKTKFLPSGDVNIVQMQK